MRLFLQPNLSRVLDLLFKFKTKQIDCHIKEKNELLAEKCSVKSPAEYQLIKLDLGKSLHLYGEKIVS